MSHGVTHLRTLGGLDLRGPDGAEARSVLAQPKRLGVLLYLATATPRGFSRRDSLLALFWPESDGEHARRALNRTAHFLRHELGRDLLVRRGDEDLGLADGLLWCDVTAFEQAIEHGTPEEALEIYRGDFAPGFFVDGLVDFERWVESERTRLRDRAIEAALGLAEREETNGELLLASRWAHRAATLAPHDERAARRRIMLLDQIGDRADALDAYEEFAARLRDDLDVEPSPETQALLATVRARRASRQPAAELHGPDTTPVVGPLPGRSPTSPLRSHAVRAGLWGFALLAGAGLAYVSIGSRLPPAKASLGPSPVVAVLPFRVAGADPSLAYLHDGMVELLAMEFTGEGGPVAVDPGSALREWARAGGGPGSPLEQPTALRVARALGADLLVDGAVVGGPAHLSLTARVIGVPGGETRVSTVRVEGSYDSLPLLVAQLAVRLLELSAKGPGASVSRVGTRSTEAMRAYLAGREAYRHGRYDDAAGRLATALDLDSAYVPAAFWLALTAGWIGGVNGIARVREIAWNGRFRLGEPERGLLEAFLGPRFPEPTPRGELLAARERHAAAAPVSPEAWYLVGDTYFHWGAYLGVEDADRRVLSAFERSLALDTTAAALTHLLEAAILAHDTAAVRRWWSTLYRFTPAASNVLRWMAAISLGDRALWLEARRRADSLRLYQLHEAINIPQHAGLPMIEALAALRIADRVATTRPERTRYLFAAVATACNVGRPRWADDPIRQIAALDGDAPADLWRLFLASHCGDTAGVAATEARLAMVAGQPGKWQGTAACVLGRRRPASVHAPARPVPQQAIPFPPRGGPLARWGEWCDHLLAALAAPAGSAAERPLAAFDSLMRTGALEDELLNFDLARAYAARGDWRRALAAVRRRLYLEGERPYALVASLREEGRWAALAGDREGAIRAYRHYLTLRSDPDPALLPQRDSVRDELARLETDQH